METLLKLAEAHKIPLKPEAKLIFQKIMSACPHFLQHIHAVDTLTDPEMRLHNPRIAQKYRGHIRGCLWFHDPVTHEILLERKDWLMAAVNEDVWFPLSCLFPQLQPYLLTGSLTRMVSVYLRSQDEFNAMAAFFAANHKNIAEVRCLTFHGHYWLIFQNYENTPYAMSGEKIYDGTHSASFFCRAEFIPILDTLSWEQPPVYVKGAFPSLATITEIPDFLRPFFLELP